MVGSSSTGISNWNRVRPIWSSTERLLAAALTSSPTSADWVVWARTSARARRVCTEYSITAAALGPARRVARMMSYEAPR